MLLAYCYAASPQASLPTPPCHPKVRRRLRPLPDQLVCQDNRLSGSTAAVRVCFLIGVSKTWETASCEQQNSLNGAQTVEARSHKLSFPRYSDAGGSPPVTALLCFPSCLFNCGVPDCELQLRCPGVNKSLIFPGFSPESGPFNWDFMGSRLHYSSHIPLPSETELPVPRIKCEFSPH